MTSKALIVQAIFAFAACFASQIQASPNDFATWDAPFGFQNIPQDLAISTRQLALPSASASRLRFYDTQGTPLEIESFEPDQAALVLAVQVDYFYGSSALTIQTPEGSFRGTILVRFKNSDVTCAVDVYSSGLAPWTDGFIDVTVHGEPNPAWRQG